MQELIVPTQTPLNIPGEFDFTCTLCGYRIIDSVVRYATEFAMHHLEIAHPKEYTEWIRQSI